MAAWLDHDRRERSKSRRDPFLARLYQPIDGTELAKRRLRILSALFKALEDRGYKLIVEDPYRNAVQVALGEASLDLSLGERIRQYRRYLTEKEKAEQHFLSSGQKWTQEKAPTGELVLKIKESGGWVAQEWRETADEPMEDQLNAILGGIAGAFEQIRLLRERQAEELAREREIQRQRHEREMEEKRESIRLRRLLKACENLRTAADIRGLVEAVERSPLAHEHAEAFEQWKGWALEHAVRLDPLREQRLFDLEVSDLEVYRRRD